MPYIKPKFQTFCFLMVVYSLLVIRLTTFFLFLIYSTVYSIWRHKVVKTSDKLDCKTKIVCSIQFK